MRFMYAAIVAVFLCLFSIGVNAAPIARAYVALVCKSEDAALTIASMDENDANAAGLMVRQFIQAGGCLFSQRGAWAMLAEKIYEYKDAEGKPSGVWRMHGYDGWVVLWDASVKYIGKDS